MRLFKRKSKLPPQLAAAIDQANRDGYDADSEGEPRAPSYPPQVHPQSLQAKHQYFAAFQAPLMEADRAKVLALAFFLLALVEGIALAGLMPLKQAVPYFVEWDRRSGAVWVSDRVAAQFSPQDANKTFFLRQWAYWWLTIKPNPVETLDTDIPQAASWTTGAASEQLRTYVTKTDPIATRVTETKGLTREVTENATTYNLHGNQATMLLTLTERINGKEAKAVQKLLTINFVLAPERQNARDQKINPLGVKIDYWTLVDYYGPGGASDGGAGNQ